MKKENTNKIKIGDKLLEYTFEYRRVKYIRYHFRYNKLRIIIPNRCKDSVEDLIHKNEKWIYKKLLEYEERDLKLSKETSGMLLEQRSLSELRNLIHYYIEIYEEFLNVEVNRVQLRDAVYKWGSCSIKRNVTFSKNLKYLPDKLVAYIVYHELTHIIVLAHNDKFFEIIKKEFPDYKNLDKKLDQYQFLIEKNVLEK